MPKSKKRQQRRAWLKRHARRSLNNRLSRAKKRLRYIRRGPRKRSPVHVIPTESVAELSLPAHLSLTDNLEESLQFFKSLENIFFIQKAKLVVIRHQSLQKLTPEAALFLIAEFHRLLYHAPYTSIQARGMSPSVEVEEMLHGLGYNNCFSSTKDRARTFQCQSNPNVTYIRYQEGTQVVAQEIFLLVEHFKNLVNFSPVRADRLTTSLLECMTNVAIHAYPENREHLNKWGRKKWWLLGYTDTSCKEVYFAFLDQGVGMPATLKRKMRDHVLLFPFSDSELVLKAFMEPRSRSGLRFRGRGLTTLKRYVDEAPNGELVVQTGRVRCSFAPGNVVGVKKTELPLAGTLLVWHVRNTDAHNGGA